VAAATGQPISLNLDARDFVQQKYKALSDAGFVSDGTMNDARLKMARLPEGAAMIENPVGAAPAVWMRHRGTKIVCLPGVPAELKAIIEGPLQKLLGDVFGVGSYREAEILVECGDESQLAPSLRQVAAAHPEVYIKSRASTFGPAVRFRIMTSATATTAAGAEAKIQQAVGELIRVLAQAGIQTLRSKSDATGLGKQDQAPGG
jgi:molybdopterin-biosynthesis enzyme MoeA-like protein